MMSLWQIAHAHAATSTRISSGPGGATTTSSMTSGSPKARQTAARMRAMIGPNAAPVNGAGAGGLRSPRARIRPEARADLMSHR